MHSDNVGARGGDEFTGRVTPEYEGKHGREGCPEVACEETIGTLIEEEPPELGGIGLGAESLWGLYTMGFLKATSGCCQGRDQRSSGTRRRARWFECRDHGSNGRRLGRGRESNAAGTGCEGTAGSEGVKVDGDEFTRVVVEDESGRAIVQAKGDGLGLEQGVVLGGKTVQEPSVAEQGPMDSGPGAFLELRGIEGNPQGLLGAVGLCGLQNEGLGVGWQGTAEGEEKVLVGVEVVGAGGFELVGSDEVSRDFEPRTDTGPKGRVNEIFHTLERTFEGFAGRDGGVTSAAKAGELTQHGVMDGGADADDMHAGVLEFVPVGTEHFVCARDVSIGHKDQNL